MSICKCAPKYIGKVLNIFKTSNSFKKKKSLVTCKKTTLKHCRKMSDNLTAINHWSHYTLSVKT